MVVHAPLPEMPSPMPHTLASERPMLWFQSAQLNVVWKRGGADAGDGGGAANVLVETAAEFAEAFAAASKAATW